MTCKNCKLMRCEECIGKKEICSFFEQVPDLTRETTKYWPKECSVSRCRKENGTHGWKVCQQLSWLEVKRMQDMIERP